MLSPTYSFRFPHTSANRFQLSQVDSHIFVYIHLPTDFKTCVEEYSSYIGIKDSTFQSWVSRAGHLGFKSYQAPEL
jgi:hypothetical protein